MIIGLKIKRNVFSRIIPTAGDNNPSHHNQVLKAEILWASRMAENILFKSCNKTVDLIKMMFLNSPIGVVT